MLIVGIEQTAEDSIRTDNTTLLYLIIQIISAVLHSDASGYSQAHNTTHLNNNYQHGNHATVFMYTIHWIPTPNLQEATILHIFR